MSSVNENSIKAIYISVFFNSLELGSATGFVVSCRNKFFLVTNWHVFSGKNFITKECLDGKTASIPNRFSIKYKSVNNKWKKHFFDLYDTEGDSLWIEHKKFGNDIDVIAYCIDDIKTDINREHLIEYNSSYELNVTEQAFILGYPFGISIGKGRNPHAVWISGTVASDVSLELEIKYNNYRKKVPAFLIDSRTRQGQSGSPVIYYSAEGKDFHYKEGRVTIWGFSFMKPIGIYSGRVNNESDLGIVWKWSVLKEILGEDVFG